MSKPVGELERSEIRRVSSQDGELRLRLRSLYACAKGRGNRNLSCSRISVIPAVPPTLLHTLLLLHGLLPPEQEAPVDIAIQDPPPGCRGQALGLGLIGAIAGITEFPTIEAPGVII